MATTGSGKAAEPRASKGESNGRIERAHSPSGGVVGAISRQRVSSGTEGSRDERERTHGGAGAPEGVGCEA